MRRRFGIEVGQHRFPRPWQATKGYLRRDVEEAWRRLGEMFQREFLDTFRENNYEVPPMLDFRPWNRSQPLDGQGRGRWSKSKSRRGQLSRSSASALSLRASALKAAAGPPLNTASAPSEPRVSVRSDRTSLRHAR